MVPTPLHDGDRVYVSATAAGRGGVVARLQRGSPTGGPTGPIVAAGPLQQALTSDLLSQTFGMALEVLPWGDRWWARAVPRVSP